MSVRAELQNRFPGKAEIVAVNAWWDNAPVNVAGYTTMNGTRTPYPFIQDLNPGKVYNAFSAIKHDLYVVGADGTLRNQWTGGQQLLLMNRAEVDRLRDALIDAMK